MVAKDCDLVAMVTESGIYDNIANLWLIFRIEISILFHFKFVHFQAKCIVIWTIWYAGYYGYHECTRLIFCTMSNMVLMYVFSYKKIFTLSLKSSLRNWFKIVVEIAKIDPGISWIVELICLKNDLPWLPGRMTVRSICLEC